eukprot:scaffold63978_cov45-Phaeocystis_antarctica.AAC.1
MRSSGRPGSGPPLGSGGVKPCTKASAMVRPSRTWVGLGLGLGGAMCNGSGCRTKCVGGAPPSPLPLTYSSSPHYHSRSLVVLTTTHAYPRTLRPSLTWLSYSGLGLGLGLGSAEQHLAVVLWVRVRVRVRVRVGRVAPGCRTRRASYAPCRRTWSGVRVGVRVR